MVRRVFTALRVTLALVHLAVIVALLAGTVPGLFGWESFVVLSDSMAPTLQVGDLVVVAPTPPEDLRAGDIITYRLPQQRELVATHRLVDSQRDGQGRLWFETKGDANADRDAAAVDPAVVLGRVAYWIPKIGYLVQFAKEPVGITLLIGIPSVLLALDFLRHRGV